MPTERIFLSVPHMNGREQQFVADAFGSNWLSCVGPNIDAMEREYEKRLGVPVAALASGTAAIHLGLRLLGVQSGDEVFCSTLTFVASANPILYLGAKPVFVDSNASTWNMDPLLLAQALHDRAARKRLPRAVIVVHLYGQCADMDPILEVCREFGVPVLEDAAESLGAQYRGRPAGTLGEVGVFSFNGNKIITGSAGGLLVTHEPRWIARVKQWAAQSREPGIGYEHRELGHNYAMSNVLAGIVLAQLEVLDDRVRRRREIAFAYRDAFAHLDGIRLMPQCDYGLHTNWLSVFEIDEQRCGATRDALLDALGAANIEARPVWKPLHRQPLFRGAESIGGAVSEELHRTGLCLPSSSCLTRAEQDRVIGVVRSVFQRGRLSRGTTGGAEQSARISAGNRSGKGVERIPEGPGRSVIRQLLGQPPSNHADPWLEAEYRDQTVLVTGAGGTIGSELARWISRLSARRLVLFDRSENDLSRLDHEIDDSGRGCDVVPIVGDISDVGALRDVFREYRPDIILHAAAYKHVVFMESQPIAAIRNNVFGARAVAVLARRYGARSCVLVSTDKAVSPTSVLGASKRIAELLFVSAPQASARRYRAVRLGNVLSSNGSVVPIFEGQIAAGRPLTVTDAEATRYVVTLTEAANVLLRAAVMDDDARLFVPSMRDPVRVIDIAYATMDHAGLPATQYLPIEVTGLRPGEKRHEDLLYRDESVETTSQATIVGVNGSCPSYSSLRRSLRALRASCNKRDVAGVCDRIQDIVPEFWPSQTLQALISGWKLPLNLRRLQVPGPTAVGIGYATGRYERVHQPIADR